MLHRAALSHCRAAAAHLRSFSSLLRLAAADAADAPRRLSRPTFPLPRRSPAFSSLASAIAPSSIHAPPHPAAPNRDKIILKGLVFFGRHGVHSAERQLGQKFVVDAELSTDLALAGAAPGVCDLSFAFFPLIQLPKSACMLLWLPRPHMRRRHWRPW